MKFALLAIVIALIGVFSGCSVDKVQEAQKMVNESQENLNIKTQEVQKNLENTTRQTQEKVQQETQKQINNSLPFTMKYQEEQIAVIKTNQGDIKVKLYTSDAPKTVNNFLNLAEEDFYNNTLFHRVIKDFMIQGGDPLSKEADWSIHGTGGPGYAFEDEFNDHKLVRGSLAMANSGPNTNGSQFFIVTANETPHLDGRHTNFGEVIEGMEIVDKIEAMETDGRDHPIEDAKIEAIEIVERI
jgi:peptidyl-prolyl cis-trans isomerase B (cyclophilin B)